LFTLFFAVDHQQRTKIPKKNRRKKNKNSKNKSSSTATPGRFDFSPLLNVSFSLRSCVICICMVCAVFIDNQAVLIVNDVEPVCLDYMSMCFCFCPGQFMHQIWVHLQFYSQ